MPNKNNKESKEDLNNPFDLGKSIVNNFEALTIEEIKLKVYSKFSNNNIGVVTCFETILEELQKKGYSYPDSRPVRLLRDIVAKELADHSNSTLTTIGPSNARSIDTNPTIISGLKAKVAILNDIGIIQLISSRYQEVNDYINPNQVTQILIDLGIFEKKNKTTIQPYINKILNVNPDDPFTSKEGKLKEHLISMCLSK